MKQIIYTKTELNFAGTLLSNTAESLYQETTTNANYEFHRKDDCLTFEKFFKNHPHSFVIKEYSPEIEGDVENLIVLVFWKSSANEQKTTLCIKTTLREWLEQNDVLMIYDEVREKIVTKAEFIKNFFAAKGE